MISVSHHCAVRNELLLHARLISMIKRGCFDDLKKRLYNDFFMTFILIISVVEEAQVTRLDP